MKAKYHIYTTIALLLASCHTYNEKFRRGGYHYTSLDSSRDFRYGYQINHTDTFGRRWYFYTDSSFHYHADSGLHARSGWLSLYENGRSGIDALGFTEHAIAAHTEQEDSRHDSGKTQLSIQSLIVGVTVVLLFVLLIKR